jgi:hypothetical protein
MVLLLVSSSPAPHRFLRSHVKLAVAVVLLLLGLGSLKAHGHWDPRDVYKKGRIMSNNSRTLSSYAFQFKNWMGLICEHLVLLTSGPDYVIVNAGATMEPIP